MYLYLNCVIVKLSFCMEMNSQTTSFEKVTAIDFNGFVNEYFPLDFS